MLTQDWLKEEMWYRDGTLLWRKPAQGRRVNGIAGSKTRGGYIKVKLLGDEHFMHRLVWLYFNGKFPNGQLDHINRIPWDNRIENLRESTTRNNNLNKEQTLNRKLPANIYAHRGRFRVDLLYRGIRYKSPGFKTLEEAEEAKARILVEAGLTH